MQMEPFVARIEVDAIRFMNRPAARRFEEVQSVGNRMHDLFVGRLERRMADEIQIPVLGVMQIGESAVDQRTHEVQCQARALIASQQQLRELRTYAAHAALSHPGQWLDFGENGYLTNGYLDELCAAAQARLFVSYATGGADWYPDHLSFMFSGRNPARTALLTAHWERPEKLKELLAVRGCGYHYTHALDLFRFATDGRPQVSRLGEAFAPLSLYRLDHGDPPFLRRGGHN